MERVDADRLDRMRRALSAFSGSPESPPARRHPLERSLEALLAALESLPETDDPDLAGSLARASESMARVVDGAMVRAEAGLDEPEWIEIRKLMESVRLSTNERSEADGPALHVELGTDASEVWGHHELLALALVHLVEHGRRGARPGERVEIRVGQVEDDAGTPSVEFRVGLRDAREGSRVGPRDGDDTGPGDDASAPGGLAEAIAIDVARAHHGELLIREDEDGRPIRCLRIPRPD